MYVAFALKRIDKYETPKGHHGSQGFNKSKMYTSRLKKS